MYSLRYPFFPGTLNSKNVIENLCYLNCCKKSFSKWRKALSMLKVYGCENLPQIKGSTPNAYAVIVGDCAVRTCFGLTNAKKSQNPEWNETFKFDFFLASTIEIHIIHKKFGYDIDIGTATLNLLDVRSSDKIPVPIIPLTKEPFTGTVYVSVKFGFPDINEKEPKFDNLYFFVTATYDPPIQLPPNVPMPIRFKCLAYDKKNETFMIFDEKSYGFNKIISSGNKMVFTGSGLSNVYILLRPELNQHKVLFLIESDTYDGIVTINIGMKKHTDFCNYIGPNEIFLCGDYEIFKSFQMEIGSKQYLSSPIYLSFKNNGKIKVHNNELMMINSGENSYSFENNIALRLSKKEYVLRRNIVPPFNQIYLFPYLIQKSNYLSFVTIPRMYFCHTNAYVFNSSGTCIFGNEKISKNHDEPIYNNQRKFGNFPISKEIPTPFSFDLRINLTQFSEPGTTIFITGEYFSSKNTSPNIDSRSSMPFLLIGDNDRDIAFGKFPILYYKLYNQAVMNPKKVYPVILFTLSFINGEWIYTPINDKLKNLKKETIEKYASNYFNKA